MSRSVEVTGETELRGPTVSHYFGRALSENNKLMARESEEWSGAEAADCCRHVGGCLPASHTHTHTHSSVV